MGANQSKLCKPDYQVSEIQSLNSKHKALSTQHMEVVLDSKDKLLSGSDFTKFLETNKGDIISVNIAEVRINWE